MRVWPDPSCFQLNKFTFAAGKKKLYICLMREIHLPFSIALICGANKGIQVSNIPTNQLLD
jgi:hypothetical protein